MFEELIARVRSSQAQFEFELSRTFDPYRLTNLLAQQAEDNGHLIDDANQMVKELEDIDE